MVSASNAFTVTGKLVLDTTGFNKSIDSAQKKTGGLTGKLKGLGGAFLGPAGIAAAAAGAGVALFGFANKVSGNLDRVDKLSQKLGLSTTAFQEWDFIAERSGTSAEKLGGAIRTMTSRLEGADRGLASSVEAFDRLGIATHDAEGNVRSTDAVFDEAISKLAAMTNEGERSAAAYAVFGGKYQELLPIINSGAEGIEAMRQEVHALGAVQSEEAVKAGAKFQDNLTNIKAALGGVATNIANFIIPTFNKLFGFVQTNVIPAFRMFWDATEPLRRVFGDILGIVGSLFSQIFSGTSATNELSGGFDSMRSTLEKVSEVYYTNVKPWLETTMVPFLVKVGQTVVTLAPKFSPMIQAFRLTWMAADKIITFVSRAIDKVKELARAVADSPIGDIASGVGNVVGAVGGFLDNVFHDGGVVPGRPGQNVPAILEAGETVIPAGQGAPVVNNITNINNNFYDKIIGVEDFESGTARAIRRSAQQRGRDLDLVTREEAAGQVLRQQTA